MNLSKKLKPYGVPDDLIREIRELIVRDALTGLYNRRYFNEALSKAEATARRYKQPLSLILLDINHFKSINDQQGYAAGDRALKTFADILTTTCRQADLVCRFGGDEFAIILPSTTQAGAKKLSQRIQAALPDFLSAASGIAALPAQNMTDEAETAMRASK